MRVAIALSCEREPHAASAAVEVAAGQPESQVFVRNERKSLHNNELSRIGHGVRSAPKKTDRGRR